MRPLASRTQTADQTPFDNSTNGFTATNVQAAIEEAKAFFASTVVTSVTAPTTSSSTDALLTGMTMSLAAGTYFVDFTTTMTSDAAGAVISISFYRAGTQLGETLMKISPFDGGALSATTARGAVAINHKIVITGTQTVEVRWSISNGNGTCGPRIMRSLRVPA